jgi:hypothetical protein
MLFVNMVCLTVALACWEKPSHCGEFHDQAEECIKLGSPRSVFHSGTGGSMALQFQDGILMPPFFALHGVGHPLGEFMI